MANGKWQMENGRVNVRLFLLTFSIFHFPFSIAAAAPATRSVDVAKWFAQLADNDPAARDAARISLMGLKRAQLVELRRIVELNRPPAPEQSAALHDIVCHVYLSEEAYAKNPLGFLGVMLQEVHLPAVGQADEDAHAPQAGQGRDGVLVAQRVPGFCGFRYLQENDIVIGVLGQEVIATPAGSRLTELVKATAPGDTITLQIIRQGKVMRLSFPVDARPLEAEGPNRVEEFRNPRLAKAQEYWLKTFAPLLEKLS